MRIVFTIIFILLANIGLYASPTNLLDTAVANYKDGNYNRSIQIYNALIDSNYLSEEIHYNLANAYYKNNDLAYAILHFEKAIKINPSMEDAKHNLEIANGKTIDKIDQIPELFLYRWWKSLVNLFSLKLWTYGSILLFILFVIGISLYFLTRDSNWKKITFYIGTINLFLALFFWFMAFRHQAILKQIDFAIIIEPTVNINSSPSEGSSKLFVLHEGTKVKVKNSTEGWTEVSLPNGNSGWIENSLIAFI